MPLNQQNKKLQFPWMIYIKLAKFHSVFILLSLVALFILFRENLVGLNDGTTFIKLIRNTFFYTIPIIIISYLVSLWVMIRNDENIMAVISRVSELEKGFSLSDRLKLFYQNDEWTQISKTLEKAEEESLKQLHDLEIEHDKIHSILSSITDGIFAINKNREILFLNNQFKKCFVLSETFFNQTKTKSVRNSFNNTEILECYENSLLCGESETLLKFKILKTSNEPIYLDIFISPLKDNNGTIFGALGIFHDVTQSILTEQMRVDFVANVSHEVRTPLTSIKGYTQLLQGHKKQIPEELHQFLDKILINSDQMINLFSDLLDLSVLESHAKVNFEQIEAKPFFDSVVQTMKQTLDKRQITLHLKVEIKNFIANKRLFEQVLTNLIDNASKYSPIGSSITIFCLQDKNKVIFKVKDEGPGIEKSHHKRIFERFYRIKETKDFHEKGTGIGLSLVKHIIQKHDGIIFVESELGKGATFVIEIPMLKIEEV